MLQALERTISRDSFTPHYKYYDDPYLTPTSKQFQRQYALSLESGRKTGMWVYKEHAELFRQNIADPIIQVNVILNVIKIIFRFLQVYKIKFILHYI